MASLVLMRHGESAWNAADVFTGWLDVGLSERGARQAQRAGALLSAAGTLPDVVHTLRALVKHLESLSDDAVADLEIPNATPLRYHFQPGRPVRREAQ